MIINDETLKMTAEKSILNAEALIEDADLLREAKRYQRAYALYQFSIEEVGKAISSVLLLIQVDRSHEDIREYQKNFKRHQFKLKKSSGFDLLICQFIHKGNYEATMNFLETSISEDAGKLDEYKNQSLYTGFIGNDVKTPSEMINEGKMNYIWFRAITRFEIAKQVIQITLKSYNLLRVYQKENGSIKDKSLDAEKAAKDFWDEILST